MNVGAVAVPVLSVTVVTTLFPPTNIPVAPEVGAVKVTGTPLTGFESASSTEAPKGTEKAVLIPALCGVPWLAMIVAGAPAPFVKLKLAGLITPVAVAITTSAPAVVFAVKIVEVARPLALVV